MSHIPRDDRQFRRLCKRLVRRDGDNCHRCGRRFADRDQTFVGDDAADRVVIVGACCVGQLKSVFGGGFYFSANEPKWKRDDREWFARNPRRSYRLRPAHADEWPVAMTHTVVRQKAPGVRFRLACSLTEHLPPRGEAPEGAAWAIFDLIQERTGDECVDIAVADILARWRQLDDLGSA